MRVAQRQSGPARNARSTSPALRAFSCPEPDMLKLIVYAAFIGAIAWAAIWLVASHL